MKFAKTILAGTIMAACVPVVQADVTVYITGATAFRAPAITEIKGFLDGGFVGIYGAKSGVTNEGNAANSAFRGTSIANPALGNITVKCAWGGSVGGVRLIQSTTTFNINDQPGVAGWIPDSALPAGSSGGTITAGAEGGISSAPTIVGADTVVYPFERGAGAAKPDAAFTDAFQSSALGGAPGDAIGLGTDVATGKIGVIPFDFVVCNGVTPSSVTKFVTPVYAAGATTITYASSTGAAPTVGRTIAGQGIGLGTTIIAVGANSVDISTPTTAAVASNTTSISAADTAVSPINNISANQANQLMTGGGRLPMFTGLATDAGVGVYMYGRNADSGTRVSQLGESGRGIANRPSFHLIPTFTGITPNVGKGGLSGNTVASIARWPIETVLGTTYTAGQGGYTSGGDLADALTSAGSTTATFSGGVPRAGWMIGYVGRSDSSRAVAKTFGQNTAKRLTFNGQQDWIGLGSDNTVAGAPTLGFNDDAIRQGVYHAWEFEHFYKKSTILDGTDKDVALDALALALTTGAAPSGSVLLSTMAVTRSIEGGPVSYQ